MRELTEYLRRVIETNECFVDWDVISCLYILSEEFIHKHSDNNSFLHIIFNEDLKDYSKELQLFILNKIYDRISLRDYTYYLTDYMINMLDKYDLLK